MTNQNSKDLAATLDESKIQMMVEKCVGEILEQYEASNAEIIVFGLVCMQSMLKRAIESRTPYPKKMQVGSETGHNITVTIDKPTSAIDQLNELVKPN